MARTVAHWHAGALQPSPARLTAVVLAHAALLAALANAPDTPDTVSPPRPLSVRLIAPEHEAPAPAQHAATAATPPAARPSRQPVLAATRAESVAAPQPAIAPQPAAEAPLPAPATMVMPPQAASTVADPTPAAVPVTPARPADYRANPKPPYPSLSRRIGEEGTVRLSVLVNPDGSVARLELAQSSGHPRLDRAALETVRSSWTFEPAREGDRPVAAWVIVPIQFTLRS